MPSHILLQITRNPSLVSTSKVKLRALAPGRSWFGRRKRTISGIEQKRGTSYQKYPQIKAGGSLSWSSRPVFINPSSWLRNLALLCRFGDVVGGTISQRLGSARRCRDGRDDRRRQDRQAAK